MLNKSIRHKINQKYGLETTKYGKRKYKNTINIIEEEIKNKSFNIISNYENDFKNFKLFYHSLELITIIYIYFAYLR